MNSPSNALTNKTPKLLNLDRELALLDMLVNSLPLSCNPIAKGMLLSSSVLLAKINHTEATEEGALIAMIAMNLMRGATELLTPVLDGDTKVTVDNLTTRTKLMIN